jgi:hypothetical protein
MRYALLLLLCTGCNATAAVDHASIIADIAVRYAAIVCRPQPTPTPDTPAEGCVEGCRCNGTGKEKSGDGLSGRELPLRRRLRMQAKERADASRTAGGADSEQAKHRTNRVPQRHVLLGRRRNRPTIPSGAMKLPFKHNLTHDVWNRLPASKYLLGRRRVAQLVERAVADWPMAQLAGCEDREEQLLMGDAYAQRLARKEFGSVMVLLFIGLITALVQVLLEWWLLKNTYRGEFALWKAELR